MKDTATIHPDTAFILMHGVLGRLKDMGGRYGDVRAVDIEFHQTEDTGVLNYVHVDYDMPEGALWEDKVDVSTVRLALYPPLGGEPIILADVMGGYPRRRIDGPVMFVGAKN